MYKIWCNIFKETKLWCSIDKFGIFRGTINLPFKDENENIKLIERPDWRFNLKPHWDINPWVYSKDLIKNEPHMYQGLVALDDCPIEVGGFCVVPGSVDFIHNWCKENPQPELSYRGSIPGSHKLAADDIQIPYLQNVPLRKGEIVIFDSGQVHCNFSNYSNKMRLFQFIRMLPATLVSERKDKYAARIILKKYRGKYNLENITLTPLARKLIGLDQWYYIYING